MNINEILFFVLAGLTLISAFLTIASKNPIHSILFLIITFFSISGHYILLNAQFLAVVNIIVYAGAIMVLFLFVVMLMNLNREDHNFVKNKSIFAAVIITGIFITLTVKILYNNEAATNDILLYKGDIGLIENLGKTLYSEYVLPFELSSILFICAMIGAVMLSKRDLKKEI